MITICYCVSNCDINRHQYFFAMLLILSHQYNWEKRRFTIRDPTAITGKGCPWRAGYAVKISRLSFFCFNSLFRCGSSHIFKDILIKYIKIFGKICPAIRKSMVIIMKNSIIWNNFVPGTKVSIFIFKHFKIIDAV